MNCAFRFLDSEKEEKIPKKMKQQIAEILFKQIFTFALSDALDMCHLFFLNQSISLDIKSFDFRYEGS